MPLTAYELLVDVHGSSAPQSEDSTAATCKTCAQYVVWLLLLLRIRELHGPLTRSPHSSSSSLSVTRQAVTASSLVCSVSTMSADIRCVCISGKQWAADWRLVSGRCIPICFGSAQIGRSPLSALLILQRFVRRWPAVLSRVRTPAIFVRARKRQKLSMSATVLAAFW